MSSSGRPCVLWTIKARRHFRRNTFDPAILPVHLSPSSHDPMEQDVSEILKLCFPQRDVVVQDVLIGYRTRPGQHILLVEVIGTSDQSTGTFVVKIGPTDDLEQELNGWQECRPPGLNSDLVFLPLLPVYQDPSRTDGTVLALIYGDAVQFLGVPTTCTLETAVLNAVQFGRPTVRSVCEVLVQLYERIGHLFYHVSREDDPSRPGFRLEIPRPAQPEKKQDRLRAALEKWDSQERLRAIRIEVDNLIQRLDRPTSGGPPSGRYLGPVRYLADVLKMLESPTADREHASHINPNAAGISEPVITLTPRALSLVVPGMLRGHAHGDLHGRNILVAEIRDRVLWPTVFDYEDMGRCNYVGWDFVKLETELKIRAYEAIFSRHEPTFVKDIHRFELDLDEKTENHHLDGNWPLAGEAAKPEDRLRIILLQLRNLAALHLGYNRGRPNRWLEEYYFLLACYGVVTGHFENLLRRELLGAMLSAGVAVSRLSWVRRRLEEEWQLLNLCEDREKEAGS
jgi:hypothetical protein